MKPVFITGFFYYPAFFSFIIGTMKVYDIFDSLKISAIILEKETNEDGFR